MFVSIIPIVKSISEVSSGDTEAAGKTLKKWGSNWEGLVDSTPVVGHVKGVIHYATGDSGRGDEIMKSASRPIGVVAGGVAGGVVGGPAGAVAGGVAGGAAADGIITGVESTINGEYRPYGYVQTGTRIVNGEARAGEYVDTVLNVAGDGLSGYLAGRSGSGGGSKPSGKVGANSARTAGGRTVGGAERLPTYRETMRNLPKPPSYESVVSTGTNVVSRGTIPKPQTITMNRVIVDTPDIPFNPVKKPGPVSKTMGGKPAPKSPFRPSDSYLPLPVRKWIVNEILDTNAMKSRPQPAQIQTISHSLSQGSQILSSHLAPQARPVIYNGILNPSAVASVPIAVISSHTSTNTKKPSSDESDEEGPVCNSVPDIENGNRQRMQVCQGSKPGHLCTVHCLREYRKSKAHVECIQTSPTTAEWDLRTVQCQPLRVSCKDSENRHVDWFIIYRLPSSSVNHHHGLVGGESYVVMTDLRSTISYLPTTNIDSFVGMNNNLKLEHLISSVRQSPLGNTLGILYENVEEQDINYIMYSDQPPDRATVGHNRGHVKGVLAHAGDRGFFLSHSLPRFPEIAVPNRIFPSDRNGQIFMCISLDSPNLSDVLGHVETLSPHIYQRQGELPRTGQMRNNAVVRIQSQGGFQFDLFSKPARNNVDIYSKVIAPYYGTSFYVQFWRNGGGGRLESVCPEDNNGLEIRNIKSFDIQKYDSVEDQYTPLSSWETTTDHSKWAVSFSGTGDQVFCAADLNRMTSQTLRSGGAVCMIDLRVASTFRDMIRVTDPCL